MSLKLRSFGKMVISQNYFNGRECQDFWPFLFFSIFAPAKVKISQFPSSKERKQAKAHEKLFQDSHWFFSVSKTPEVKKYVNRKKLYLASYKKQGQYLFKIPIFVQPLCNLPGKSSHSPFGPRFGLEQQNPVEAIEDKK